MAGGYVLHIGGATVNLQSTCTSEHKLNVKYGNETLCANATTDSLPDTLHVLYNGTIYSICDGECGGGGQEYIMPTTPPDPVQLDSSCTWTQNNLNAYLESDGNQYFDTRATVANDQEVEITAKIVNGTSAQLYGTSGAKCFYDVTVDDYGEIFFRIGTSTYGAFWNPGSMSNKHVWTIKNYNPSAKKKYIYLDTVDSNGRLGQMNSYTCSADDTILIFKNDWKTVNLNNNGGIRLYSIKVWNKDGTLIHQYQPVQSGTSFCNYTAPTNALWDTVTKRVLLPGGTGQTSFGTD